MTSFFKITDEFSSKCNTKITYFWLIFTYFKNLIEDNFFFWTLIKNLIGNTIANIPKMIQNQYWVNYVKIWKGRWVRQLYYGNLFVSRKVEARISPNFQNIEGYDPAFDRKSFSLSNAVFGKKIGEIYFCEKVWSFNEIFWTRVKKKNYIPTRDTKIPGNGFP